MLRGTVFLFLLVGALAIKPLPSERSFAPKDDADDAKKWLLPGDVTPSKYELTLMPNVDAIGEDNKFTGNVLITVNVNAETEGIVLHKSDDLTITKASLKNGSADDPDLDLNFDTYDNVTNKLTLKNIDASAIPAGDYKIYLEYSGINGDEMHGFYRSSYVNAKNETRWLLTTQFESYDARRAFPCFDEPRYKAKYVITVIISAKAEADGYSVLSNMPIADGYPMNKSDNAELRLYQFQESAKVISSYLVAFIISDFEKTSQVKFGEDKEFTTWAQEGPITAGQGNISQLAGPAALNVIAKNIGVPYGYPKVDQVGIPDFNAGAMENWGLVTYRERMILFDEDIHPISQKQSVVTVTTHELGHQWFGDLVTLQWWSDIWLNEGFATFFEYHASDEIAVEGLNTSTWKLVYQMVVDELQAGAFATDAQPNSRALTTQVYSPGQIDANFDDVAYAKGGSVIRMWMHTLGRDKFYSALKSYLEANQESVGTPEKLLAEFDKVVPDNLKNVLKPTEDFAFWHNQAGYPVLHVSRTDNQSVITQERYLVSGSDEKKLKWTVPITVTTSTKPDFTNTAPSAENIFKSTADNITVNHDDADWVLFNVQQTGYYRVNYDAAGWQALTEALIENLTSIHEVNRAQLLDDALWLARSTNDYHTGYDVALNLTKFLNKEVELIPWKTALNGFNFLYGKLQADKDVEPKIKDLILNRLEGIFSKLSLDVDAKDSHTTRILRPLVASMACRLGLKECVEKAQTLFAAHLSTKGSIHPDVRGTVVCTGIRESTDDKTWGDVWDMYTKASDNAEQTIYLSALGCSKNQTILEGYLNKTITTATSGIRRQDFSAVFSSVLNGNPENVGIALDFLTNNLESIAESYGGTDPLGGLLTGVAGKLGTEDDVKKITKLKDEIEKSTNEFVHNGLTGAIKAVDIVTGNKEWFDNNQKSISDWLDSDSNDTKGAASTTTVALLTLLLPAILLKLLY